MVSPASSYLRPAASDEASHPPGEELWWNESWYFDAVSHDGRLGVYSRIGRVPNQGQALVTASVVGPGRPAILLVATVPLPAADDPTQAVDVPELRVEHQCQAPLERFRVTLAGEARAHDDQSAPLRGRPGTPVKIAFDLTWDTDGLPYAWRRSTRYEIPCRVTGTVAIDGERLRFAGQGQRDHSWGVRDWFASDWMWCALHLEDGTHVHAVGIPGRPEYGVGYVQGGGRLAEVSRVETREQVADDGLIDSATISVEPDGLALDVAPVAFGAVLLRARDGRTSEFPRAMADVRSDDGRVGRGWIEWNRNRR